MLKKALFIMKTRFSCVIEKTCPQIQPKDKNEQIQITVLLQVTFVFFHKQHYLW